MFQLATVPSIDLKADWLSVLKWGFIFYISISFVCVTFYTLGQVRAGRLLNNRHSPATFIVPPWLWNVLAVGVLSLFFFPFLFYALVVMAAMVIVADKMAGLSHLFGVRNLSPWRLVVWSLLLCGAIIFVVIPLADWANRLLTLFHIPNPEQTTVVTFKAYFRWKDILVFVFQAVLLSPIIEELFFRGFMFNCFKNHTSIIFAAVLSGGIVAFAHVNLGAVIPLWFLGFVLALAYQHTGSLLLPICVHGLFNLMTALSLQLDKWGS
jgi:membrane protease YdiL (CAAX protease family)